MLKGFRAGETRPSIAAKVETFAVRRNAWAERSGRGRIGANFSSEARRAGFFPDSGFFQNMR